MSTVRLPNSERQPYRGATPLAPANPHERLEVTILLRRKGGADALKALVDRLARGKEAPEHLSRESFADAHGASSADIAAVRSFATTHGMSVVQQHAGRRTMVLSGSVAQFNAAFGVDLQYYAYDGGSYRGRTGVITLPTELEGVVEGVLGLDNRPAAQPHCRRRDARAAAAASFTPTQIANLYQFPPGTGAGQCIALIELGGGYRPADLAAYFHELGINPAPKVTAISVDHAGNHPTGNADGPDGEVMLDIEIAGAVAPGAHIAVYFAPNTDAGFLNAITTAAHDTVNKPDVISISWGGPESDWTGQATTAFDSAFQAAAAMGLTVLAASGDNGATDGAADGAKHVDFPASSPHATGCGGTHIAASHGGLANEVVWNDLPHGGAGGGGVSAVFATPSWQAGATVTNGAAPAPLKMRGVPDIAADADPESGYKVRVDGQETVFGGTSVVAPLWAGLIARINAANGRTAGLINPIIYAHPEAMNDVTVGNNGGYQATKGWDACTGLGSPIGTALQNVISAAHPGA